MNLSEDQVAETGRPRPDAWSGQTVAVTGGAGFLGKATVRLLDSLGARTRVIRSADHDLRDPGASREALSGADVIFHLAARVGGIGFNGRNPGLTAHDNLLMSANVFEAARDAGASKLVAACSVCAYPDEATVPFREDEIWQGRPDGANAPYGLAKRMMLVLSEGYRRQYGLDSCVPVLVNLYGPGDNFDLEDSHVVAALVRKYVEAERQGESSVVVWGSGRATREFLYVDDAARALVLAAERYDSSAPVNVGSGEETEIRSLAELIARLAGYRGETRWDADRPDGQLRRCLDVSRARERMGFQAEIALEDGLRETIESFREPALG